MKQDKAKVGSSELEEAGGKLRLFVPDALSEGAKLTPSPGQIHYLLHVMRAKNADIVRIFNGRDGEFSAEVAEVSKRACVLICRRRTAPQRETTDVWLAFAPIKKTPADFVVQKATELGVSVLQPVTTRRTIASRVNLERMSANAVEAAEQSERLSVPDVRAPVTLAELLRSWPRERVLIFCDEGGEAAPIAQAISARKLADAWGVLTGPEGGFDPEERALIRAQDFVLPVTLGPRIMRADTAALAALSVWQSVAGDWTSAL